MENNKYYWGVSIKNRDRDNAKLWFADLNYNLIKVVNHCYKGNGFSDEAKKAAKELNVEIEKDDMINFLDGMSRREDSFKKFKHNMELDKQSLNFKKPIKKIVPKGKYYIILLDVSKERRIAGDTSSKALVLDKNFHTVDVINKFWDEMGDYSKDALLKMKKYNVKRISNGGKVSDLKNSIETEKSINSFYKKNPSYLKGLFNKK